jgi:hypothetical protein
VTVVWLLVGTAAWSGAAVLWVVMWQARRHDARAHELGHHCRVAGCPRPGTNNMRWSNGHQLWVCDHHVVGLILRGDQVYDQQLDGTDLGQWEREMPG